MSSKNKPTPVYVYNYGTMDYITSFHSIREAERKLGVHESHIRMVLGTLYDQGKNHYQAKGYWFSLLAPESEQIQTKREEKKQLPRILLLDIETAPCIAKVWTTGKQYVGPEQIIEDRFILGVCAKWLYEPEMITNFVRPKEALERNDFRIMNKVHSLINQADIIIGHNLKSFDLPILQTRFLKHKLSPNHPLQVIDTCLVARKQFGNVSNALNYINKSLGLREKIDAGGWKSWDLCTRGDKKALDLMAEYCGNDVLCLEENYLTIRPFIKLHPNLGLYAETDKTCCPNCGSTKIKRSKGNFYFTPAGKYEYFVCECGTIGRYRQNVMTRKDNKKTGVKGYTEKRKNLGISTAR